MPADSGKKDPPGTGAPEPAGDMTPEELRRFGHAVVDWIADYRQQVESLPVMSRVKPGEVRGALPAHPPEKGEPFAEVLRDLDRVILPGVTHWQSPSWFAYFPCNASGPSVLGELVSAGLGVQGMLWSTSPAATELETLMLDWLVEMLALPERFLSAGPGGGVIQDTASSSTLCAVIAAREKVTDQAAGTAGCRQPLVAYASREAHSSVEKAIRIAGIGRDNLRLVDVDAAFAMRPDDLAARIGKDREEGRIPFLVCTTVGTTSCLAVDPLAAIGPICRDEGLWLHVDAAMAGTAALCPELRHIHAGLEHADSYVFNPHKWMMTNFDCSCFWVADRDSLVRALTVTPEYLRSAATGQGVDVDYRNWQIPLGRRFRALKLWFVIRHFGVEGLQRMVRAHVEMARDLAGKVEADPEFELAAPPSLNIVAFRHRGGDAFNRRLQQRLAAGGALDLTHTSLGGRIALRLCVAQAQTAPRHVSGAWDEIRSAASELSASP